LAEASRDSPRAARAAWLAYYEGLARYAGSAATGTPLFRQWAERLDRHAQPGTPAGADADTRLAYRLLASEGRWAYARPLIDRARDTATRPADAGSSIPPLSVGGWEPPTRWAAVLAEPRFYNVDEILRMEISTWEKQTRLANGAPLCLARGDRDGADHI